MFLFRLGWAGDVFFFQIYFFFTYRKKHLLLVGGGGLRKVGRQLENQFTNPLCMPKNQPQAKSFPKAIEHEHITNSAPSLKLIFYIPKFNCFSRKHDIY